MQVGTGDPGFPKHFDGSRFYTPDTPPAPGLLKVLRWKLTSQPEPSPGFIADVEQTVPPRQVEGSGLRTTLVNHSTVLLQQHGVNILTDPIWSERTSPLSWVGPRRRRKPGVSWQDVPSIDVVLISHNHYDIWTCRRCVGSRLVELPHSLFRLAWPGCFGPRRSGPCTSWIGANQCPFQAAPSTASRPCISQAGEFTIATGPSGAGMLSNVRSVSYTSLEIPPSGITSRRFGKSSGRHISRYYRSERTNRAGSCRQCICLPMRRSGHMRFWPPGSASRSTTGHSSWRTTESTLRKSSSRHLHLMNRFSSSGTARLPRSHDDRPAHSRAGQYRR